MTKRGNSFGYDSNHVLRGRVNIGDIFVRGSVFFLRDVVKTFCIFSFLYFLDTLFLLRDSKPCTYDEVVITVLSPIFICVVSFLPLYTCFLLFVCNLLFPFHTKMS